MAKPPRCAFAGRCVVGAAGLRSERRSGFRRRNNGRSSRSSTLSERIVTARLAGLTGAARSLAIGTGDEAGAAKRRLENSTFTVASVESKPQRRNPPPPFITSTLQQEALRKLGYDPSRTMQIAQRLYEGIELGGDTVGLITYMRTDGFDIAPEALTSARRVIEEYGARYLPDAPRRSGP